MCDYAVAFRCCALPAQSRAAPGCVAFSPTDRSLFCVADVHGLLHFVRIGNVSPAACAAALNVSNGRALLAPNLPCEVTTVQMRDKTSTVLDVIRLIAWSPCGTTVVVVRAMQYVETYNVVLGTWLARRRVYVFDSSHACVAAVVFVDAATIAVVIESSGMSRLAEVCFLTAWDLMPSKRHKSSVTLRNVIHVAGAFVDTPAAGTVPPLLALALRCQIFGAAVREASWTEIALIEADSGTLHRVLSLAGGVDCLLFYDADEELCVCTSETATAPPLVVSRWSDKREASNNQKRAPDREEQRMQMALRHAAKDLLRVPVCIGPCRDLPDGDDWSLQRSAFLTLACGPMDATRTSVLSGKSAQRQQLQFLSADLRVVKGCVSEMAVTEMNSLCRSCDGLLVLRFNPEDLSTIHVLVPSK
jgi:hypothetical protein